MHARAPQGAPQRETSILSGEERRSLLAELNILVVQAETPKSLLVNLLSG